MYENVPICGECWINDALTKPERCLFDGDVPVGVLLPVRVINTQLESCGFCFSPTKLGAYMRVDSDDPTLWVNKLAKLKARIEETGSVEEQRRYSDSERPSIPQLGPMTCTFELNPDEDLPLCLHCGNGPDAPIHQKPKGS